MGDVSLRCIQHLIENIRRYKCQLLFKLDTKQTLRQRNYMMYMYLNVAMCDDGNDINYPSCANCQPYI